MFLSSGCVLFTFLSHTLLIVMGLLMFLGQAGTFLSFQARCSSATRSSTSDLTVLEYFVIGENMIFFKRQEERQNGEYETRKKSRGQIEKTFRPGVLWLPRERGSVWVWGWRVSRWSVGSFSFVLVQFSGNFSRVVQREVFPVQFRERSEAVGQFYNLVLGFSFPFAFEYMFQIR